MPFFMESTEWENRQYWMSAIFSFPELQEAAQDEQITASLLGEKDVKVGEEEAKITLFLEDQGNNFHYYRKRIQGKNLHNSKELKRVSEYIRKQYLGEHRHQCEQLEMLIEIFRDGPRSYSSIELIDLINETIIKNGKKVFIDGLYYFEK